MFYIALYIIQILFSSFIYNHFFITVCIYIFCIFFSPTLNLAFLNLYLSNPALTSSCVDSTICPILQELKIPETLRNHILSEYNLLFLHYN